MTGKTEVEWVVRVEDAAAPPLDPGVEVRRGELLAWVGPRGCGKTALLRLIAGLAPVGPSPIDVSRIQTRETDPGVVWGEAALLPWRTVRQNILLGAELRGLAPLNSGARVRHLLGLLGAADCEDAMPGSLTPGNSRRAALCCALIHRPGLLLLDDPFRGLDPLAREQLWLDVQRLWMNERFSAILATTDIVEAVQLGDRVAVLSEWPARVQQILVVDLPRPRRMHKAMTHRIAEYGDTIRTILRAQGALP